MRITTPEIVAFHREITKHYYEFGRHDMAWRRPEKDGQFDPYKILVSEMMLQQTQVDRVTPKYAAFLKKFPDVHQLAKASLGDVLKVWNGLGYNRRAKYIWQAARAVEDLFAGVFPRSVNELKRLPGIGPNTAGAIMAYAYDEPVVFIETNIRTVIIHHFFQGKHKVSDEAIYAVMEKIVPKIYDSEQMNLQGAILGPREFYYAMMDYGTHLKKMHGNVSRASKHYTKQSSFKGSTRQLRGEVIRQLTKSSHTPEQLAELIDDKRLPEVIQALAGEGLIVYDKKTLRLG